MSKPANGIICRFIDILGCRDMAHRSVLTGTLAAITGGDQVGSM
ncbi:hypothetical protein AAGW05_15965 [Arthrobacter sp. LAPM80]